MPGRFRLLSGAGCGRSSGQCGQGMRIDEPDDVAFSDEMAIGAKGCQRSGNYLADRADVVGEFLVAGANEKVLAVLGVDGHVQ